MLLPLTPHPCPSRAVLHPRPPSLMHPSQIPLKKLIHMRCHQKNLQNLPQFHILDQENFSVEIQPILPVMLPVKSPQACYIHFRLRRHWRSCNQNNLPQFQILDQGNVPVYISQVLHHSFHLVFQQKHLPHIFIMNQRTTLPVDIHQGYHIHSHMTYHWWSLSQISHIH